MKRIKNNDKFINLRKKYDFFEYQSYKFYQSEGKIIIEFNFNISNKYFFKPKVEIPIHKSFFKMEKPDISNIVFNLGMIELISYWKTACPPRIIVRPHKLSPEQIQWWKKLYFNGLGEFFYLNEIKTNQEDFVEIISDGSVLTKDHSPLDFRKVIVPIGGGKDSVVTLEILKNSEIQVVPMMLNPGAAAIRTVQNAKMSIDDSYIIKRFLDHKLLEMNADGFLNGHTPFSSLLAFSNVLLSLLSGIGNIALSNENSANESTVPGTNINHQYSKSFEFEMDFDSYVRKYIHSGINYFSFLRPLNELQIARLFSDFKHHFSSFRSCNVGSKNDDWCGKCPKCLFTYIILSPFIDAETLGKIFGKNMLSDASLKPILLELSGKAEIKPFECVGTIDEVNAALNWFKDKNLDIYTLALDNEGVTQKGIFEVGRILGEYNKDHNLPEEFENILNTNVNDKFS